MEKIDFKKSLKHLYAPTAKDFVLVDVPQMWFVKVDGSGDPNTAVEYKSAVEWVFRVSYATKFMAKATLNRDYVVPPLEALWWADDPQEFASGAKNHWKWTVMIMVPGFITKPMVKKAVLKAQLQLEEPPATLRFEPYAEGRSLQILHVGSYDDEAPTLARLHDVVMPQGRLSLNGPHHEIYLSDPRKVIASKLRTILRQPVR